MKVVFEGSPFRIGLQYTPKLTPPNDGFAISHNNQGVPDGPPIKAPVHAPIMLDIGNYSHTYHSGLAIM